MVSLFSGRRSVSDADPTRTRWFFLAYGTITIVLPAIAGVVVPSVAAWCAAAMFLVFFVEAVQLEVFVGFGRDDDAKCRCLGWVILARFVASVCLFLLVLYRG